MNLDNKTLIAWKMAQECSCHAQDCNLKTHRLCGICHKKMIFNAHISEQPTARWAWNLDHIKPLAKSGDNSQKNLHAVHVKCNQNKADN